MPSEPAGPSSSEGEGYGPLPSYIELLMASSAAHATEDRAKRMIGSARFSVVEKLIALAIAGLGLYGLWLIAGGFYLKAIAFAARAGS